MNLHSFYAAFTYPKHIPDAQEGKAAMVTAIVAKLSRGSALLQRGKFSTRADIDARIDKLAKHDFLAG